MIAAIAGDRVLFVERKRNGLPQHDPNILNEVVVIDEEISLGADSKV